MASVTGSLTVEGPPEDGFPLHFEFPKARGNEVFISRAKLSEWRTAEGSFWSNFASQIGSPGSATQNRMLIDKLDTSAPVDRIRAWFDEHRDAYYPSTSGLGLMVSEARARDPQIAGWIFNGVTASPQQPVQWQQSPGWVEAMASVAFFRNFGFPAGIRTEAEGALNAVRQYQFENAKTLNEYRALLIQCADEWKKRINDYATNAALQAPKIYWQGRAERHEKEARIAKGLWVWSLRWFVIGFTAIALALLFFGPALRLLVTLFPEHEWLAKAEEAILPASGAESIANAAKPFLVLGTLLGIGVWWLRQQLRDLRSHEHLAEDAAERVTMIETYAALKEADLQSGDLTPILSALYRPSSTGLIDDSGPVTPLELVVKTAKSAVNASGE